MGLLLTLPVWASGQLPWLEPNTDVITLQSTNNQIIVSKTNRDTTIQLAYSDTVGLAVRQYIDGVQRRSPDLDGHVLYSLLLKPLEPLQEHLVFVTSGMMDSIGMAGLVTTPQLGFHDMDDHAYLVLKHTITYQKSIEDWQRRMSLSVGAGGTSIWIDGEPEEASQWLREARDIRDHFGGKICGQANAECTDLESGRIVHVAQASGDWQAAGQSGGLAGCELLSISGQANAREVLAWDGIKAVLMSGGVPDPAMRRQLITRFYRELFDGQRKGAALQAAQQWYINQNPAESHPAYWANWRLYGDIKSVESVVPTWLYLVLVGLLLAAYALVRAKKVRMF